MTAHRLVTCVARERSAHDGTVTAVGAKTCAMLAAAADSIGEPWQHRTAARELVRHVIAMTDHLASYVDTDDKALARVLLSRRAWALRCLNGLRDSRTHTLVSQNNLAGGYRATGRMGEAIRLYERTLAGLEQVVGEKDPTTFTVRQNLAIVRRLAELEEETPPA